MPLMLFELEEAIQGGMENRTRGEEEGFTEGKGRGF